FRLDGPGMTGDTFEANNTMATAYRAPSTGWYFTGMSIHTRTDVDWYRIDLPRAGTSASYVQITFTNALGNLALALYNAAGKQLAGSAGTSDRERISLASLPAGTYYAKVYGAGGAMNANYRFDYQAPAAPAITVPGQPPALLSEVPPTQV